jgi:hypothetical protein
MVLPDFLEIKLPGNKAYLLKLVGHRCFHRLASPRSLEPDSPAAAFTHRPDLRRLEPMHIGQMLQSNLKKSTELPIHLILLILLTSRGSQSPFPSGYSERPSL